MSIIWPPRRWYLLLVLLIVNGGFFIWLVINNAAPSSLVLVSEDYLKQWQQVQTFVATPGKIERLLREISRLYGVGCQQITVSSLPPKHGQPFRLYAIKLQLAATSDLALKRVISHLQHHAAAFVRICALEMRRVGRLPSEGLSALQVGAKPKMVVLELNLEWITIDAMAA